jgi:hypothetical protein
LRGRYFAKVVVPRCSEKGSHPRERLPSTPIRSGSRHYPVQ